jgi:hypothetical protein
MKRCVLAFLLATCYTNNNGRCCVARSSSVALGKAAIITSHYLEEQQGSPLLVPLPRSR